MLSRKTVFVVGAGASAELNLPIGEGLKGWIADALKLNRKDSSSLFLDTEVNNAVSSYVAEAEYNDRRDIIERFKMAAHAITDALPFALSIDQYLDSQRNNPFIVKLGKLGIASSILKAERESKIGKARRSPQRLDEIGRGFPREAGKTWHLKLVQLLTAGRPKEELADVFQDVAFIVFNYDRCLEYYLTLALSSYYGEEVNPVRAAFGNLKIVHPYGQVGNMIWQDGITVPFGGTGEGQLRNVAEDILTFTESAASGVTSDVRDLIESAETLVFMGFGFLPQNVDLLEARKRANVLRIFYTTYGISRSDTDFVDDDLKKIAHKESVTQMPLLNAYGEPMQKPDAFEKFEEEGTCNDLMNNHWMRLTR